MCHHMSACVVNKFCPQDVSRHVIATGGSCSTKRAGALPLRTELRSCEVFLDVPYCFSDRNMETFLLLFRMRGSGVR
jgi:hypothetical protein